MDYFQWRRKMDRSDIYFPLFIIGCCAGIVGAIVSRRNHNRREKFAEENLKYQHEKDEPEDYKKDDKSWDGV